MRETVQISKRFCGPPNSGNGGYVAGLIAKFIGPSAKVRLTAPPPLDEDLVVEQGEDKHLELKQGDSVLGHGYEWHFELDIPPMPSLDEARNGMSRYIFNEDHVFPTCFVCGTARDKGDGLRVFPGPTTSDDWRTLACVWEPSSNLIGADGYVGSEYIWAALDCPTYFGVMGDTSRLALLGEFELSIVKNVPGEEELMLWCWPIKSEGRKHFGGAALADKNGTLLAYARGTWVELKQAP